MKQLNHQEIGTSKLQQFSSNPGPLLQKPGLCFWLSWVDSIIMPLIMVILRFNLQSLHFNLPLNLLQIRTPLQSNQLMMIK